MSSVGRLRQEGHRRRLQNLALLHRPDLALQVQILVDHEGHLPHHPPPNMADHLRPETILPHRQSQNMVVPLPQSLVVRPLLGAHLLSEAL